MKKYEKREVVKIGEDSYIVLRQLHKIGEDRGYLVTDGSSLYQMRILASREIAEEKLEMQRRLVELGVPVPSVVHFDVNRAMIIRDYVEGDSASKLILRGELEARDLRQIREMARRVEEKGYCLDYFPSEFICNHNKVYYVRCDIYSYREELSFASLFSRYWISAYGVAEEQKKRGI